MHPLATTYAWTQRRGQDHTRRVDADRPAPRRRSRHRRTLLLLAATLWSAVRPDRT